MLIVNELRSHRSINDITFGCAQAELLATLGEPDAELLTSVGEIEFHYHTTIYRCFLGRFVECTFPDAGRTRVNGVTLLDVFEWLGSCADVVDRAGFRISLAHGIAYDHRDPSHGSITVFERHRWDELVLA